MISFWKGITIIIIIIIMGCCFININYTCQWQKEKRTAGDEVVGWRHRLIGMNLSKLWEMVMDRGPWRAAVHEVAESWTRLNDGIPPPTSRFFSLLLCSLYQVPSV